MNRLIKKLQPALPSWEFVAGYEQICCCLAPQEESYPLDRIADALGDEFAQWHLNQERHKTFLYPRQPCKLEGLRSLGVDSILIAAGDDETYDTTMLASSVLPATLATADRSIIELVESKGGYVTRNASHAGAVELLTWIERELTDREDP